MTLDLPARAIPFYNWSIFRILVRSVSQYKSKSKNIPYYTFQLIYRAIECISRITQFLITARIVPVICDIEENANNIHARW